MKCCKLYFSYKISISLCGYVYIIIICVYAGFGLKNNFIYNLVTKKEEK